MTKNDGVKPINQKNTEFVKQLAERMDEMQLEGRSLWQDAKRRFFRNKAAMVSLIMLGVIVLFITFAPSLFLLRMKTPTGT